MSVATSNNRAATAATAQSRVASVLADPRCKEMRRDAVFDRKAINEKERTVEVSFASEAPVDRWFGREILEISDAAADLTRLNNGGALLHNHDWNDQIGVVERAWIDVRTKKARAIVRFSRSARGEEIFRDVLDLVRRSISFGYVADRMEPAQEQAGVKLGDSEGMETFVVTSWRAFEVSIVACPADINVGVGRSRNLNHQPHISVSTSVNEPAVSPAAEIAGAAQVLAARHTEHADAINRAAYDHIQRGLPAADFNGFVLNKILATNTVVSPGMSRSNDIGLPRKDVRRYSILKAVRAKLENRALDGLEGEASRELELQTGRRPLGFFLPDDVLRFHQSKRALVAGNNPEGGYTIGTDILANETTPLLRNTSKSIELGARILSGLRGDIAIPRQLTGATAYWLSEAGEVTSTSATFGQISGKPRRLAARSQWTKQFFAQTSLDAETFVSEDISKSLNVELDRVTIDGDGGTEPLGILNLATADRSTSVTFSGAATWAKYLEFESNVAASNALLGRPAYLTTPSSRLKAKSIPKFSNTATPIWETGTVGDTINGYRCAATNQFPSSPTANQVIFGDFGQILILDWMGRDVVVDPYSLAATGQVVLTITQLVDVVIREAKAFAISTDSGAQ